MLADQIGPRPEMAGKLAIVQKPLLIALPLQSTLLIHTEKCTPNDRLPVISMA